MASGAACTLVLLTACQSPWIACTIVNRQATPVSLVEVAYPGGSFGIQTIAPGASFHYRFHALGTETTTIDFADAAHKIHTIKGPEPAARPARLAPYLNQPGNQVTWTPELKKAR